MRTQQISTPQEQVIIVQEIRCRKCGFISSIDINQLLLVGFFALSQEVWSHPLSFMARYLALCGLDVDAAIEPFDYSLY